ncbi:Pre-mRNA-splicing factor ISY1-like protein [Operophtera brumata]|uniref:Pre-mRNA-splicing factor ISY1-like protein n=1 Tax=Operophtera brumata TaxID=104452 RepID=A0A0L7KUH6_OPEBR|nr:Pre-mRNA-splicing factor ISY1-like protein [Operophtera brumata]
MDETEPETLNPSVKSQEYFTTPVQNDVVSLIRTPTPKSIASPQRNPSPGLSASRQSALRRFSPPGSLITAERLSNKSGTSAIKSPIIQNSPKNLNEVSENLNQNVNEVVMSLEPRSLTLSDHINELTETVNKLSRDISNPLNLVADNNIDKIANMSKVLTDEASALRKSIRCLSEDIVKTKQQLLGPSGIPKEDVNFPYHLFLIEIIVNKIHMKCDCFGIDFNNLVISATFLGKQPIALYDSSYGKLYSLSKINVGKSILFAMTYDKICSIKEFEVIVELTKQPPCSNCVQRIGETHMDYTNEFNRLREELCQKWMSEQPDDNILCTTSSPLSKNMYYVACGDVDHQDSIGVIEISTRMSFLGKEITTAFSGSPKPQGTSALSKDDRGMTMYSCQNVEMDDQGKVLLDEEVFNRKLPPPCQSLPMSQESVMSPKKKYEPNYYNNCYNDDMPKYDEILTKMNANELKIRVPKSTRIERMGKYDKIQELCSCESTAYNTGEQLQIELPRDLCGPDKSHRTHTSNLTYTYNGCDKSCEPKNRKIINVTPTNCPVPVAMEKTVQPHKDVFILKIGKKLETKNKKTELEIQLTTPKAPDKPADKKSDLAQQCSTDKLKLKKKKSKTGKKKGKGKDKKVGKDKKTGLGEFRIRDLNDEINKLMREKRHWEVQIKSLGGPDHARVGPRMLDQDGKEPPPPPRRTRADLMRDVDADYYGYRDDDDGMLLPLEKEAEKDGMEHSYRTVRARAAPVAAAHARRPDARRGRAIARAVEEWKSNKELNKDQEEPEEENIYPEDKDIEEALLRRKKQELLEKYGCLDVKMES